MTATTVWNRIVKYNPDSAASISTQYRHTEALILNRLSSYSGLHKYHGHASGKGGDGEHAGASDNREAAIAHLLAYTPPAQTAKIVSIAGAAQKSSNTVKLKELSKLISSHTGDIPSLRAALTLRDPNWESIDSISNSFAIWRTEKKNQHKSQQPKKR